jgi:hypothetical protein
VEHDVVVVSTPNGYIGMCGTCGWRGTKWYGESAYAQEEVDDHEIAAKTLRLNTGPRPSARSVVRVYRANAENPTYTPGERELWSLLAEELETELAARTKGPLEGQLPLF